MTDHPARNAERQSPGSETDETGRTRAHVLVSGRAQGVFFRASTRQKASELGVSGWVMNRPDGRVEAVFEGGPAAVRRVVEWMHEGPERAMVDGVEVDYEEPRGESGFSVS
jgi:acylphosphatase